MLAGPEGINLRARRLQDGCTSCACTCSPAWGQTNTLQSSSKACRSGYWHWFYATSAACYKHQQRDVALFLWMDQRCVENVCASSSDLPKPLGLTTSLAGLSLLTKYVNMQCFGQLEPAHTDNYSTSGDTRTLDH